MSKKNLRIIALSAAVAAIFIFTTYTSYSMGYRNGYLKSTATLWAGMTTQCLQEYAERTKSFTK